MEKLNEVIEQLRSKGKVTVVGGPQAAEVARLLARHADNAVVLAPHDRRCGLKLFEVPSGTKDAWAKGTTVLIVVPEAWNTDDLSAAVRVADTAVYTEDGEDGLQWAEERAERLREFLIQELRSQFGAVNVCVDTGQPQRILQHDLKDVPVAPADEGHVA